LLGVAHSVRVERVTERWGVKVTAVEIREVVPPREVQEAMNRQMSAEGYAQALQTVFGARGCSGRLGRISIGACRVAS
jgi:hypothetical protein